MPVGNTRIEDAALCPRCKVLGILTKSNKAFDSRGHECDVAVYTCDNERCRWYGTGWTVQSTPDGRVYDRERKSDGRIEKDFPNLTAGQMAQGRAIVEQVTQAEHHPDQELEQ